MPNLDNLSEDQQELLRKLILKNPEAKRKLLNSAGIRDKYRAYYNEEHGQEIKKVILAMIEDGDDRMYSYEMFPKLSQATIRQKIFTGIQFAVDNLDDEKQILAEWRRNVKIEVVGEGVKICMTRNKPKDTFFGAVPITVKGECSKVGAITRDKIKLSIIQEIEKLLPTIQIGKQGKLTGLDMDQSTKLAIVEFFQTRPEYMVRIADTKLLIINQIDPNKERISIV